MVFNDWIFTPFNFKGFDCKLFQLIRDPLSRYIQLHYRIFYNLNRKSNLLLAINACQFWISNENARDTVWHEISIFFSISATFLKPGKKFLQKIFSTKIYSTGEIMQTKIACRIFLVPFTENVQIQNYEIALVTLQVLELFADSGTFSLARGRCNHNTD